VDDRKKYIYKDLAYTIFFLLAFIAAYIGLSEPEIINVFQLQIFGIIPAILLFFAVFFFFTLLNQIFSKE